MFFETKEAHYVDMQKEIISSEFKSIASDLMYLSEQNELKRILRGDEAHHWNDLAEEFLSFSNRKGLYDQIRFLDETGMEVVKVNFNDGKPYIAPKEQIQSKAKRSYFEDTFQLERGEVYVSPFHLNIEEGKIEQPLKPIIRFGTPVFDSQGQKRGIVLLNYLGAKLFYKLERAHIEAPDQFMLLNSDGFWLKSPRAEDEWGFMYEGSNRTFGNVFPEAWRRISSTESGQFHNADGMFTFATVYPPLLWSPLLGGGWGWVEAQKSSAGLGKTPRTQRRPARS